MKLTPQEKIREFMNDFGFLEDDPIVVWLSFALQEATKAERERNMNIVLNFQLDVEHTGEGKEKIGAVLACIELRKRMK